MDETPSEQSTSTLKRVIHDAFDGVRLGQGVSLWEGQAIDDYAFDEERQQARERDEKTEWGRITAKDLNRCSSSLSFFDADGMRFHLPAYMMLVIDGFDETDSLIFRLTKIDEYMADDFSALNQIQRDAVYDFLRWYSHHPDSEYHRDDIQKALNSFWSVPL